MPIGSGIVHRQGTYVTIIRTLLMMHHAMTAAKRLADDGIRVEVIDTRQVGGKVKRARTLFLHTSVVNPCWSPMQ